MDPLTKVVASNVLPGGVVGRLQRRMKYVAEAVTRVEKASGLAYPVYYVEPVLPTAVASAEVGRLGVLYARTLPVDVGGSIQIIVELSSPLVLFASKATLQAVLAHEFLHYMHMAKRFVKFEVLSDERSSTLVESAYSDATRLLESRDVFKDRGLLLTLKRRMPDGLKDEKLDMKTLKQWIEKRLPCRTISPESNIARLKPESILASTFPPDLVARLNALEQRVSPG